MATLISGAYGKTGIRLTYVDRSAPRHLLREVAVKILFSGDFADTYLTGNNGKILPTDTMKNTVYVVARTVNWSSVEILAQALAEHFLTAIAHLHEVRIEIEETPWAPIGNHHAAFIQSGGERRTTTVIAGRRDSVTNSGVKGLQILKTANSGFTGYIRDQYTTLPETLDRLLGTVLEADWKYSATVSDFNDTHRSIRSALLDCFAGHQSLSVQQTLFAMGKTVVDRFETVEQIKLMMPNKHCLLVDLGKFGLDNPNQVFVPTDEPSGYIEACVRR